MSFSSAAADARTGASAGQNQNLDGNLDLATRYQYVRSTTERLAEPLSPEDQVVQSMDDVSPTKWHRAHVTWFFETFLLTPHLEGYRADPTYGYLFNSYYEAVGERHPRPKRGLITRPSVSEVAEYRRRVDDGMRELLAGDRMDDPAIRDLVVLGLHHEQQHQELLLMDIKHVLSSTVVRSAYRTGPAAEPVDNPAWSWVDAEGGVFEIGHREDGFCFDNEQPVHETLLRPFRMADRAVTAGDWLEFMEDGGYRRPELWLSDGWHRINATGWEAPSYWRRSDDGSWLVYTLDGERQVNPGEPVVHVSYYEADAFARWADARLPTEAEWEVAARSYPIAGNLLPADNLHPVPVPALGQDAPNGNSADSALEDSVVEDTDTEDTVVEDTDAEDTVAQDRHGEGSDHGPLRQLYGDVWEWTSSPYVGYPGFSPAPGAVGEYNGKFMVDQQVLRGGCAVTPDGHVRPTYRNFFPAHARWQFGGLRLATDR